MPRITPVRAILIVLFSFAFTMSHYRHRKPPLSRPCSTSVRSVFTKSGRWHHMDVMSFHRTTRKMEKKSRNFNNVHHRSKPLSLVDRNGATLYRKRGIFFPKPIYFNRIVHCVRLLSNEIVNENVFNLKVS